MKKTGKQENGKLAELKKDLAAMEEALVIAEKEKDTEAIATDKETIATIKEEIAEVEKEEKPATEKKATKKAPAAKKAKKVAEPKKPVSKMTCKEIKEAAKKREELRKLNPTKKTKPVFATITDKIGSAVKSAIYYNKEKKELNVPEVKKAIDSFADALDDLQDALAGKFSKDYIKNFKKDLYALLKEVEDKGKKS